MSQAISPAEAKSGADSNIPDYVIDVFNELIIKNYNHGSRSSQFTQNTAIEWILIEAHKREVPLTRPEIFEQHMLDIEQIFERAGWKVHYDKPDWGQVYDAFYRFSGV